VMRALSWERCETSIRIGKKVCRGFVKATTWQEVGGDVTGVT